MIDQKVIQQLKRQLKELQGYNTREKESDEVGNKERNRVYVGNNSVRVVIDRRIRIISNADSNNPRRVYIPQKKQAKRGKIRVFSRRSRARMAQNLLNVKSEIISMITLTTKSNLQDAQESKGQLKEWLTRMKMDRVQGVKGSSWQRNDKIGGYFWIMEFQKRGAIHYHVFSDKIVCEDDAVYNWLVASDQLGDKDSRKYACKVKVAHGDSWGNNRAAAISYAIKYGLKNEQKKGHQEYNGRFWGRNKEWESQEVLITDYNFMVRMIKNLIRAIIRREKANRRYSGGLYIIIRDEMRGGVYRAISRILRRYGGMSNDAVEKLKNGERIGEKDGKKFNMEVDTCDCDRNGTRRSAPSSLTFEGNFRKGIGNDIVPSVGL